MCETDKTQKCDVFHYKTRTLLASSISH